MAMLNNQRVSHAHLGKLYPLSMVTGGWFMAWSYPRSRDLVQVNCAHSCVMIEETQRHIKIISPESESLGISLEDARLVASMSSSQQTRVSVKNKTPINCLRYANLFIFANFAPVSRTKITSYKSGKTIPVDRRKIG